MYKYSIPLTVGNYYRAQFNVYLRKPLFILFYCILLFSVFLNLPYKSAFNVIVTCLGVCVLIFPFIGPLIKYLTARYRYKYTEMEYLFSKESFGYSLGSYTLKILSSDIVSVTVMADFLLIKAKHQNFLALFQNTKREEVIEHLKKLEYPIKE